MSRNAPTVRPFLQDSDDAVTRALAVLAEILAEVERRGPEGHWLSRDSPLVARARSALAMNIADTGEVGGATDAPLRELLWRVDHVRNCLLQSEVSELVLLAELLDTTEAKARLP